MNISLSTEHETYIVNLIKSGEYKSTSSVISDALRLHKQLNQKSIDDLRRAIAKGWDGKGCDKTVSDILKSKLGSGLIKANI